MREIKGLGEEERKKLLGKGKKKEFIRREKEFRKNVKEIIK